MLKSDPRANTGLRELEELEDRIEKLRHSYDLFFAGIDNIDPTDKKAAIRRLISKLNEMRLANPRARFRFQSLAGRFVSLNQYWTRVMREIENGNYRRDIFRSRINKPEEPKAFFGKEAPILETENDEGESKRTALKAATEMAKERDKTRRYDVRVREISEDEIDKLNHKRPLQGPEQPAPRTAPPATPPAAKPTPKPAAASNGSNGPDMNRIYDDYVSARKRASQNTGNIDKETLRREIDRQTQTLKKRYKTDHIDFRVVEKDGRVVLRPVVKKGSR